MKNVYLENKYFANSDNESDRYNKKGKKEENKSCVRNQEALFLLNHEPIQ